MAKIIAKTVTDNTLILGVREWLVYPFNPTGWLDLRAGFFLSVTSAVADDPASPITGLGETLPSGPAPQNFVWIGLKTAGSAFPIAPGIRFIGYTNNWPGQVGGASGLASSDIGIGTSDTKYWRPTNSAGAPILATFQIVERSSRAQGTDGTQQHFPQDVTGAGGYAVFHAIQLLRQRPTSNQVWVRIKRTFPHTGDVLFTSDPNKDLLVTTLENLHTFPDGYQQLGPVTLGGMPNALYAYWPFHNSRLRIHALGVYKAK